ncbi:PHD-finger domain-containing protein [Phthorimaea operculella]|nr:PHD-finger domain-containing protein [Phthorimaea operculella]
MGSRPACSVCNRTLAATGGVTCSSCQLSYHNKCVNLRVTGPKAYEWTCPGCTEPNSSLVAPEMSKNNLEAQSSGGSPVPPSPGANIFAELNKIYTELVGMREKIDTFREEMKVLTASVTSCKQQIQEVQMEVKNMQARVEAVESSQSGSPEFKSRITDLEEKLNTTSQELLLNDLQITGIPECNGENVHHIVQTLALKIGAPLEDQDIVDVYRVGQQLTNNPMELKSKGPRPLIVRLARRSTRDAILKSSRVRRNLKSTDIDFPAPASRIYINERLTKQNRILFKRARVEAKKSSWKYVWTKNGKIYAKKTDGKCKVFHITSDSDFKIFENKDIIKN